MVIIGGLQRITKLILNPFGHLSQPNRFCGEAGEDVYMIPWTFFYISQQKVRVKLKHCSTWDLHFLCFATGVSLNSSG